MNRFGCSTGRAQETFEMASAKIKPEYKMCTGESRPFMTRLAREDDPVAIGRSGNTSFAQAQLN
jgi:hypothetical protein